MPRSIAAALRRFGGARVEAGRSRPFRGSAASRRRIRRRRRCGRSGSCRASPRLGTKLRGADLLGRHAQSRARRGRPAARAHRPPRDARRRDRRRPARCGCRRRARAHGACRSRRGRSPSTRRARGCRARIARDRRRDWRGCRPAAPGTGRPRRAPFRRVVTLSRPCASPTKCSVRSACQRTGRPSRRAASSTSGYSRYMKALGAEAAADVAGDDAQLVRRDLEHLAGERLAQAVNALAADVQRQAAARRVVGRRPRRAAPCNWRRRAD